VGENDLPLVNSEVVADGNEYVGSIAVLKLNDGDELLELNGVKARAGFGKQKFFVLARELPNVKPGIVFVFDSVCASLGVATSSFLTVLVVF